MKVLLLLIAGALSLAFPFAAFAVWALVLVLRSLVRHKPPAVVRTSAIPRYIEPPRVSDAHQRRRRFEMIEPVARA